MREHQEKVPFSFIQKKFENTEINDLCFNKNINYDKDKRVISLKMMGETYCIQYPTGSTCTSVGQEVTGCEMLKWFCGNY